MNRKLAWVAIPIYIACVYIFIRIKAPYGFWYYYQYHGTYMSTTNMLLFTEFFSFLLGVLLLIIVGSFIYGKSQIMN